MKNVNDQFLVHEQQELYFGRNCSVDQNVEDDRKYFSAIAMTTMYPEAILLSNQSD